MHKILLLLATLSSLTALGEDGSTSVKLKYSEACILSAVARHKNLTLNPLFPVPVIFVESQTPLLQFQNAIEPQWHLRPDGFLNAFIIDKNEIYLIDDAAFYAKAGRYIDDSLAHELTHYVQLTYQHYDLLNDDSAEGDAVEIQTWFRESFLKTGISPCGPGAAP